MTLLDQLARHTDGTAVVAAGRSHSYRAMHDASARMAAALSATIRHVPGERIAFLLEPGFDWVVSLLGIWRAGGVAVPLAASHPPAELEYVIDDVGAAIVISDGASAGVLSPIAARAGARHLTLADLMACASPAAESWLPATGSAPSDRALILHTSGTTGKPKGVVTTHANIGAQIASLVSAWEWRADDRILHTLPLHHVHGIINGVGCALWSGAACEMLPRFDAGLVWSRLASGDITVFTAVPTIYHRLIAAWDAAPPATQRRWSAGCGTLRLMMSGSAALPVRTLERWRQIGGHTLLERYGMTEIGMALANPLDGPRRPGFVGLPLPGVEVRLVDESGGYVTDGTAGEVEVRGPGVFREYWRREAATRDAFRDGWFRTGDVGVVEDGSFRLLGRTSVDIIKTGGHKVSALEIEEVLRSHAAVVDCAVVATADPEWGERVCAALVLQPGAALALDELQAWAKARLAPYKVPRALRCVEALPRNAMGKVLKPDVAALFNPG